MSVGRSILDFLFGKSPNIFDEDGNVRHHLGDHVWKAWEERFHTREYDWHNHTGMRRVHSNNHSQGCREKECPDKIDNHHPTQDSMARAG